MSTLKYISCIVLLALSSRIYSQIPDTSWTKTFGGPLADVGNSVKQTNDGGFIVAGTTSSFGAGGQDIYLIKTDGYGDTLWTKTFGGTSNDRASNVVQTNDNGYAIFGATNSFGNGGDDFLLWKTDSLGNTEWFKTYGSSTNERGYEGRQTFDDGFVIVGDSLGQNDDALVIKTDEYGNRSWTRKLHNIYTQYLYGRSIQQTSDSGYIVGCSHMFWYNGSYAHEWRIFRLAANGDPLFWQYYWNVGADFFQIVRETQDGNFILGGNTAYEFIWLVKISPTGSTIWSRIISVSQLEVHLSSIESTIDNGFILTAISYAVNWLNDIILLKTDGMGIVQWEKRIGGNGVDDAHSVYPTYDDGYIVTGQTNSFGAGDYDIWLLKFKYNPPQEIRVVSPNGGEYWLMEDSTDIKWSSISVDSVKIELSLNNGIDWLTIIESTPNDSVFGWVVQAPQTSWDCRIKISDVSDSTIYDISDTTFVIDMFPSVEDSSNLFPTEFALFQNYPNPFNPTTKIKFEIPDQSALGGRNDNVLVTLKVYDVLGNEIATLVNEEKPAGEYEVEFDGKQLPSGIYFYKLKAGHYIETKKMMLIK